MYPLIGLLSLISTEIPTDLEILGIEPQSGPVYGETRVIVRLKDFNSELIESYPHPSVRVFFKTSVDLEVLNM
mgnify:CR=1 FL=1